MSRKGLLFDIEYCVGCQACTVACKQENGYIADQWGVKVTELNLPLPNGRVQVDFVPVVTPLCTLCAQRLAAGEDDRPSCVRHCMTQCIAYGDRETLTEQMAEMKRPVLYFPHPEK